MHENTLGIALRDIKKTEANDKVCTLQGKQNDRLNIARNAQTFRATSIFLFHILRSVI
jgi:hypothetical protein